MEQHALSIAAICRPRIVALARGSRCSERNSRHLEHQQHCNPSTIGNDSVILSSILDKSYTRRLESGTRGLCLLLSHFYTTESHATPLTKNESQERRMRKQVSVSFLLLLCWSLCTTAQTANPSAKIAPRILAETENGRTTEALVVLSEQADLRPAAALQTKTEKGRFVVNAL